MENPSSVLKTDSEGEIPVTNEDSTEISTIFPEEKSTVSVDYALEPLQKRYEVSPLEAVACACVLDGCVDRLAVLGTIGNLPKIVANLEFQTMEEKYGSGELKSLIYDPVTIQPFTMYLEKQKVVKYQTDRSYLEKVLQELSEELCAENSYNLFVKRLNDYECSCEQDKILLDETAKGASCIENLKFHIEKEKIEAAKENCLLTEEIGKLKDDLEDIIVENGIKEKYLDNWENSRLEQNNTMLDQKEEILMIRINNSRSNIEKEIRIDAEIESFIFETQKDYEDGIQEWMEKYDAEIEAKDMQIQILKERREDLFTKLEQTTKLYHQHKQEMDDWLDFKAKRRLEEERIALWTVTAIKIQAWWRGVMVRKGFGPFRKKKKGGRDKKGKKK